MDNQSKLHTPLADEQLAQTIKEIRSDIIRSITPFQITINQIDSKLNDITWLRERISEVLDKLEHINQQLNPHVTEHITRGEQQTNQGSEKQ